MSRRHETGTWKPLNVRLRNVATVICNTEPIKIFNWYNKNCALSSLIGKHCVGWIELRIFPDRNIIHLRIILGRKEVISSVPGRGRVSYSWGLHEKVKFMV